MFKIKMINFTVIFLFLICVGNNAYATFINLNAQTATTGNPITVHFSAGTYDVIPIGTADGGTYNAWSPWDREDKGRWIHHYALSSNEFDAFTVLGAFYDSALEALANASSTTFTLTQDGDVKFFINDSVYTDNRGGASLRVVNSVPIPAAIWLFSSGLAGLLGFKFRKNSIKPA